MCCLKKVGIFLVAIMLMGCQAKQVKQEKTSTEKLSAQDISSLFAGKTVESFNLVSGSTSFTYYYPDGRVEQERYWERRNGLWKINDKSEICLAMQGKPFSCRSIFRVGQKYYKYRLGAQGQPEKIIRYRQFIEGKAF